jgi:hypothetical protein
MFRCASHTPNLIATVDTDLSKFDVNPSLKRMHFDRRYLRFGDFGIRLDGLFVLLRRLLKYPWDTLFD